MQDISIVQSTETKLLGWACLAFMLIGLALASQGTLISRSAGLPYAKPWYIACGIAFVLVFICYKWFVSAEDQDKLAQT